jgi:aminoglycoside 2''-phosphotransferase
MPPPTTPADDLVALARTIEARCPGHAPIGALRVVSDEGWGCIAFESSSGLLILVARQPEHRQWETVARLMPLLRGRLPLPVPSDVVLLHPDEDLACPVLLYPKIAGHTPTREEATGEVPAAIPEAVGRFFASLHAIPAEAVVPAGIPTSETHFEAVEQHLQTALPVLRHHLSPSEFRRVEAWSAAFRTDERLRRFTPAFRHGDLWYGNLLVDDGHVTGIIDWEDAALGDPALDLANQLGADEHFFQATLAAYRTAGGRWGVDEEYRARRWHEAVCFQWVSWALRPGNEHHMPSAIEVVRSNPVLAGW